MQYHLVWCTKYRKKVLKNGIDTECKELLQGLAEEYKFQILAMEAIPDHIHLLVYIEGQKEKGKRKKPDRRNGLLEEKRCRQYPAMA